MPPRPDYPTARRPAPPDPAPRLIRFVLSDVAVRRLRAAERTLGDLHAWMHDNVPAKLCGEVAAAYLALAEAVVEVDKCGVETAPDDAADEPEQP